MVTENQDQAALAALFAKVAHGEPEFVHALRAHGSNRRIYRLGGRGRQFIGVVNDDLAENAAFLSFSAHFRREGVPVPEVHAVNEAHTAYLEDDLGDTTLFDLLNRARDVGSDEVPAAVAAVYEKAVRWLPEIQVRAGRDLDDSVCYPRARFDRQSMMWDLNYFKYYFLKLAGIPFHEQALENDFSTLVDYLLEAPAEFFLYRDFQSRNIMVRDGEPWFIDYQGGRRGALQYDLASLTLDAKANLPVTFRQHLIDVYLEALGGHLPVDREAFMAHFDGFSLIRILQAMGAYGFRGFYERKAHFLQSVPYAIRNLETLLGDSRMPIAVPALFDCLQAIVRSTRLREVAAVKLPLTIRVESFSYKKGLPEDQSGHGGGFVFDCRSIPNPGREARYRRLAGDDPPVAAWLEAQPEVHSFMTHIRDLIGQVIQSYQRRNFTHLTVAFGCTGGQHRSVYCATQFARGLRSIHGLKVELHHRDVVREWPDDER